MADEENFISSDIKTPEINGGDDSEVSEADDASVNSEDDDDVSIINDDDANDRDIGESVDTTNDMIDNYFEDAFGHILNGKKSKHIRTVKVVHPDDRITSHIITNPERARAIAIRAKQIDTDGFAYTDIAGCGDAIEIAEKEFNDGKSPLILNRIVGIGNYKVVEKWKVREMTRPPIG